MLRMARHTMAWLAAGMMLLTACQYDGIVSDFHKESGYIDSMAISFGNGVIDNPVHTRSVTLLSEHMNTMGVWGWQTTKDGEVGCLFRNQEVTFNAALDRWTYSPERYWEEGSSYKFYAYAPHANSANGATVSIDEQTGYISIGNVSLAGDNTMDSAAQVLPYGKFSSVSDIDWMIDRAGRIVPKEQIRTRVTFNMQHILAKFNVIVIASSGVQVDGTQVVLDSMTIGSFVSKGSFIQKLDHSPVNGDSLDMAAKEWTIDTLSTRYDLNSTRNATIDNAGRCVIESLLLPQNVTDSQQVTISYSLHSADGHVERFLFRANLSEAFNSFKCANNYTLYITIGPEVITFDAGTTLWDDGDVSSEWIR